MAQTVQAAPTAQTALPQEIYTHGYSINTVLPRGTADQAAAFLLPHLRPGMSLLDAGCGPGDITLDLAQIVAPGEVVGIDVGEAPIAAARATATERGVTNALPKYKCFTVAAVIPGAVERLLMNSA